MNIYHTQEPWQTYSSVAFFFFVGAKLNSFLLGQFPIIPPRFVDIPPAVYAEASQESDIKHNLFGGGNEWAHANPVLSSHEPVSQENKSLFSDYIKKQ